MCALLQSCACLRFARLGFKRHVCLSVFDAFTDNENKIKLTELEI